MKRNAKFLRGADSESNIKNYSQGLKYELDTSWISFDPTITFFNTAVVEITDKVFRYAYIDSNKIVLQTSMDIKILSGVWNFYRFETPFIPKYGVTLLHFAIIFGVVVFPNTYCCNFYGNSFRGLNNENLFEAGITAPQASTVNVLTSRLSGIIEVAELR